MCSYQSLTMPVNILYLSLSLAHTHTHTAFVLSIVQRKSVKGEEEEEVATTVRASFEHCPVYRSTEYFLALLTQSPLCLQLQIPRPQFMTSVSEGGDFDGMEAALAASEMQTGGDEEVSLLCHLPDVNIH